MTLEEIKQYIKDQLDDEGRDAACSRGDEFACGESTAYSDCLHMLDQLEPSWHLYPQEVPPKEGWYLVTRKKVKETFFDLYKNYGGKGDIRFARDNDGTEDVIAWAELPKPYKKEDGNHV